MPRTALLGACVVVLLAPGCATDPVTDATTRATASSAPKIAAGPPEERVALPTLPRADGAARTVDLADPDLCRWASQATDGDTARLAGTVDGDTVVVAAPPLSMALAEEGIDHGDGLLTLIANLCHPQGDPRHRYPHDRYPEHPHATAFP